MDITLQTMPCRVVLKDLPGFLNYASLQGAQNLFMAQKVAVVKSVQLHAIEVLPSGVVLYDTNIPAGNGVPFDTIGLDSFEINEFFELDVERNIL